MAEKWWPTGLDRPLTDAERAFLWRRRHGLRQRDMAKRLHIHPDTLGERERGQNGLPGHIPGVTQLVPDGPEWCIILRRRARLAQWEVAGQLGVSRHVVMAWEQGRWSWERLAEFWALRRVA
jgi:DNA-binding XRE family transcriptional regulator